MEAHNTTIHLMVRDEVETVGYALLSVIDYAAKAVVVDTGSKDGTLALLEEIKHAYPEKVDLYSFQLPDSTRWDCNKRNEPNYKLTECRKWMIEQTNTEFIWVLDADEIYPDATAEKCAQTFLNWPSSARCFYVPLLWFAIDGKNLISNSIPSTYRQTCRLFKRAGLSVTGAFPGELHSYDDIIIAVGQPGVELLDAPPFHHYELVTKPWRRELLETVPYDGEPPEVFARFGVTV